MLSVLFGSGFLWISIALRGLSPIQITLGQLAGGAIILLLVITAARQRLPRDRRMWAHLVVMAVIANIAPYTLFNWGTARVGAGLAGILNATAPLFTLLLVTATRAERLSALRISGLVLGFAGVTVLAAPWLDQEPGSLVGAAACLAGATCYGVSYVYAQRFLTGRGVPPLVLSASQLTAGAVLLGFAAPVVARQPIQLTTEVALSVLVVGVFCTGIAYVLNYRLIQDDGPIAASTVNYLVPVVAVTLGVVFLAEPVTWNRLVGGAMVLLGVGLTEVRLRTPRPGRGSGPTPNLERAR